MKLIEEILSEENLKEAIKRVKANKGVAGVDKVTVDQIDTYFYMKIYLVIILMGLDQIETAI